MFSLLLSELWLSVCQQLLFNLPPGFDWILLSPCYVQTDWDVAGWRELFSRLGVRDGFIIRKERKSLTAEELVGKWFHFSIQAKLNQRTNVCQKHWMSAGGHRHSVCCVKNILYIAIIYSIYYSFMNTGGRTESSSALKKGPVSHHGDSDRADDMTTQKITRTKRKNMAEERAGWLLGPVRNRAPIRGLLCPGVDTSWSVSLWDLNRLLPMSSACIAPTQVRNQSEMF